MPEDLDHLSERLDELEAEINVAWKSRGGERFEIPAESRLVILEMILEGDIPCDTLFAIVRTQLMGSLDELARTLIKKRSVH